MQALTPPTPSRIESSPEQKRVGGARTSRSLLLPLPPNGALPPTPAATAWDGQNLFTPAEPMDSHSPPAALRRESMVVPPSERLVRVAKGSGVNIFRMDRSPVGERTRSPWVLKKTNVSPGLVRERRRVERTLEHEACLLSQMHHPHIIGFRAAQRLNDGHLCLALEHCDLSLYALVQERLFSLQPRSDSFGGCVSPARETRAGALFSAAEILGVSRCIASGLAYLHSEHRLMHGDVKSANVLVSRDLSTVKVCDLGVSIPLAHDLSAALEHIVEYEGTEPWRPPETLPDAGLGASGEATLCDRTDVFAFGLVIWEMLTGDVPHAAALSRGEEEYRAALGTRPELPPLPPQYDFAVQLFRCCTQHLPCRRPSANEVLDCCTCGSLASLPKDPEEG